MNSRSDAAPALGGRVRALDWLRGFAVPLMIQCHTLSLLRPDLRAGRLAITLEWLDGLVAPAFFLTAGIALAYVQGKAHLRDRAAVQHARTLRRIGGLLVAATLVNWMWFPVWREPRWLFRVDILHGIALSLLIVFLPVRGGMARSGRLRWSLLGCAALLFAAAPLGETVRGGWAMVANKSTGAVFPLLPWTGYVFLGAALGTILALEGRVAFRQAIWELVGVAGALWAGGPLLKLLYPPHDFEVTNPAEHARRIVFVGLALIALLRLEERAMGSAPSLPMRWIDLLGRNSLLAYALHEALLFFPGWRLSFFALWGKRADVPTWAALTVALCLLTSIGCGMGQTMHRALDVRASGLRAGLRAPG